MFTPNVFTLEINVFVPIVFFKWLLDLRFYNQKKAPIFHITPVQVKFQVQEIFILKVTSENVRFLAKVQKWWLPNLCYVFAYNFYKQHLLQVKFYRCNEKNRGFHLIPKTPFQWMNPNVIESYTFNVENSKHANIFSFRLKQYKT